MSDQDNYIKESESSDSDEIGEQDGQYGEEEEEEEDDVPAKRPRLGSGNAEYTSEECNSNDDSKFITSESPKQAVQNDLIYSSTGMLYAEKILEKYGHKRGKGLGKDGQGIVEPITATEQKGKRGLGFHVDKNESRREVAPEVEKITLVEEPKWLENPYPEHEVPASKVLRDWLRIGKEKNVIDDETHFCDGDIIQGVLNSKTLLNDMDRDTLKKTRSRANPFETIGRGIFLNRAAMKMANMDRIFDYMFTSPKSKNGDAVGPFDLLYFADVCAGPGGFSEYVFYRKRWRAKGFGFTLRRENDFKLDEFFAGPSETFEAHYGAPMDSEPGDGDVTKPENIDEFTSFVMKSTDGKGVHFMMADGGFHADDKNIQEIISRQLYLCQCLVALRIVRTDGHFVTKLFDIFTPFSVGLVYLMYRSFDRICIIKPNSSRPANSERYLVCQYKREHTRDIADYLFHVNELMCRDSKKDIRLVSLDILKDEKSFFNYICESNNSIGKRQIHHLQNIVYFHENPKVVEDRQDKFKTQCLDYWGIPNQARIEPKKCKPESKIRELLGTETEFLYSKPNKVEDKLSVLKDGELDWYWTIIGGEEALTFYLGLGRKNVYRLEDRNWAKVKEDNLVLPDGTLIYGEIVKETVNTTNVRAQYRCLAFHIVDALFLGGEDIRDHHITERQKYCELFAKSLTYSNMKYRARKMYESPSLDDVLSSCLQRRKMKNGDCVVGFDIEPRKFFVPSGLLFFCGTNKGWKSIQSRSSGKIYYNKQSTGESFWKDEVLKKRVQKYDEICADFTTCFESRTVRWMNTNQLLQFVRGSPPQD